jgi:hypothetical protein
MYEIQVVQKVVLQYFMVSGCTFIYPFHVGLGLPFHSKIAWEVVTEIREI